MELINRARGLYRAHQERKQQLIRETAEMERVLNQSSKYRFANDRWASPMPLWIKVVLIIALLLLVGVATGLIR